MGARVFLVRHWETEANAKDIMQGSGDSPPSGRGRRQAEMTRQSLAEILFDGVYGGPQGRQRGTAHEIRPDCFVTVDDRLREQHMAGWENVPIADLIRERDGLFRGWREGRSCPEGGETHEEVRSRVTEAWGRIAGLVSVFKHDILVVTSGTPIRAIVGHVLGLPIASWRAIAVDNCSITVLRWKEDGYWQVARLNDTHHLREVGVNTAFV